eukprot:scaffold1000_cov68-Phaeocystis_antarctica.AAC.5
MGHCVETSALASCSRAWRPVRNGTRARSEPSGTSRGGGTIAGRDAQPRSRTARPHTPPRRHWHCRVHVVLRLAFGRPVSNSKSGPRHRLL